ncbi:glutathione peroxidase [Lampropedia puyangensis]|uniref:Glutathione peroxidase n=1 Tax=Lampropedia puyangensis TaxID=1330072 RepID=A0A4S8FAH2_9BURK|nr:glutathione peroxidase [Lampropedia puyangensis]THU04021.1 glutathione peroxidase [Lampropedia puyangensis]
MTAAVATAFDFTVSGADGSPYPLRDHAGQVLLIVNTATQCGFTPQLKALEQLASTYADDGLVVLGFPCNQFRAQEPLNDGAIAAFCALHYGVSFPLMAKIDVNGAHADPLFRWLCLQKRSWLGLPRVHWNFTKFLVSRSGQVVARFAPMTRPEKLTSAIEAALAMR